MMFLKIKQFYIALSSIRYVQVNEEMKSIHFVFSDEEALIFRVGEEDENSTNTFWINSVQFGTLRDFFYSGEYEECSTSIDILKPLR